MSWKGILALFIISVSLSFARGYFALGQAGVLWRSIGSVELVTQPEAPVLGGAEDSLLIDLNKAGEDELETIPGIGPVLAGRILSYRNRHNGFRHVEQLLEVKGIGAIMLENIRQFVTVSRADGI